jgi:hypothetical protein
MTSLLHPQPEDDGSDIVVITDNGILARRDFPHATILVSGRKVMELPKGTRVAIVTYRLASAGDDPITAANVLVRGKWLEETGREKRIHEGGDSA